MASAEPGSNAGTEFFVARWAEECNSAQVRARTADSSNSHSLSSAKNVRGNPLTVALRTRLAPLQARQPPPSSSGSRTCQLTEFRTLWETPAQSSTRLRLSAMAAASSLLPTQLLPIHLGPGPPAQEAALDFRTLSLADFAAPTSGSRDRARGDSIATKRGQPWQGGWESPKQHVSFLIPGRRCCCSGPWAQGGGGWGWE